MDCSAIGLASGCLDKPTHWLACSPVKSSCTVISALHNGINTVSLRKAHSQRMRCLWLLSKNKPVSGLKSWVRNSFQIGTDDHFKDNQVLAEDPTEDALSNPLSSEQLRSLLADSERTKLIKKLSEANQQNRFLKRQLQVRENDLVAFRSELAALEQEIQGLVALANEIAKADIPKGSWKINGRYIQSHLLSRLEAVQRKMKVQTKDVEAAQAKEVPLFWIGMAESVQVMGSFDGWSQGEYLSPEYTGSYTKFSTKLLLKPGRYEIKFLVDGEWKISPEFPTVGEGTMENNLLVVELE